MEVAADVLATADPGARPPESVRSVGRRPSAVRVAGSVGGDSDGSDGSDGAGGVSDGRGGGGGVSDGRGGGGAGGDGDRRGGGGTGDGRGVVDTTVTEVLRSAGEVGDGRVAVICPVALVGPVRDALAEAAPVLAGRAIPAGRGAGETTQETGSGEGTGLDVGTGTGVGTGAGASAADPVYPGDPLDAPVAVLTVADCKGLEFDAVVLVEPAQIIAGPTRGLADLYVSLTRATRFLTVVYSGDLPAVLGRLAH
jgi:hypothetical protein